MQHSELILDDCLKCTLCNTACPVLAVHPAYPGPKRLGPELERTRREGIAADTPWIEYCLGCHCCDLACPNQVEISAMIARAKTTHRKPLVRGLRDWWFARPSLLGRLMVMLPTAANWLLALKPVRFLMAYGMQIAPQRKFPHYKHAALRTPAASDQSRPRILLFSGCFIRYNRPELGRTVLQLLERNGFAAEVAATDCCGVPALANGDASKARALARSNIDCLNAAAQAGMRIVTACSSCGYMLKTAFGGLLDEDTAYAGAAAHIAANSFDLAELLQMQSDAGQLDTSFQPTPLRVAYHAPCHQRAQGMGRPWFHLLSQIPGLTVENMEAGCCGISGTYGFKREKYPVSMAVGESLFKRIRALHSQMVATECATCQMQIEHGTTVRTIHPAEIMLQAYVRQAQ